LPAAGTLGRPDQPDMRTTTIWPPPPT